MRRASIAAVMTATLALAAGPAMAQSGSGGVSGQSGTSGAGSGQSSPTAGQAGTSGAGGATSVAGGGQSAGDEMSSTSGAQAAKRDDRQDFVQKAAIANMAEIQLGQLASQNAQDPQVKQFAQMMVDEHTKALEQLRSAAGTMTLPSTIDQKHQKLHDKLATLHGAEFDRAYMDAMVDAHKDAEKLLKKGVGADANQSARGTSGPQGQTAMAGAAGHEGMSGSSSGATTAGTSGSSDATGSSSQTAAATGSTSGSSTSGAVGTSGTTSSAGAPSSIEEWAASTLPKVRSHLEQARSLENQVKQSAKPSPSVGTGTPGTGTSDPRTSNPGSPDPGSPYPGTPSSPTPPRQ